MYVMLFRAFNMWFIGYCVFMMILFFFFKQKTAYEMRISDWSSDVCSSDLCQIEIHYSTKKIGDNFSIFLKANSALSSLKIQLYDLFQGKVIAEMEIGRASCRERVCQYV